MRRYQLIQKIVTEVEVLIETLTVARENHKEVWDNYSEQLRQLEQIRTKMRNNLILKNEDDCEIASYFENSLMIERKVMDEEQDLFRGWINIMNEEMDTVGI